MPLSQDIQDFILQYQTKWDLSVNAACEQFFDSCHASVARSVEPHCSWEKNIKYGEHERHRLDIYWPQNQNQNQGLPVVVYFHGGAFKIGYNGITPRLHANIGMFLASQNMIGVLATYRLVPHAWFPDGLEDVTSALKWIKTNIWRYGGDPNSIFAIGQSAGGAHLAQALFSGRLHQEDTMPSGIMLQSAALSYDLTQQPRRTTLMDYHVTQDLNTIQSLSAEGIFNDRATAEMKLPELYVTVGEFDFEECVQGNLRFLDAFYKKLKRMPKFEVLQGHNHISCCLSIGLPGDEVGPKIVQFVRRCLEVGTRYR